jgi:hypothetical protein
MRVWQENNGGMVLKLLRNGIEIILLIGLLSVGTGIYFWATSPKPQRSRTLPVGY